MNSEEAQLNMLKAEHPAKDKMRRRGMHVARVCSVHLNNQCVLHR